MAPVSDLALGMRSVIAAGCTLPGAGEGTLLARRLGALALLEVVTAEVLNGIDRSNSRSNRWESRASEFDCHGCSPLAAIRRVAKNTMHR